MKKGEYCIYGENNLVGFVMDSLDKHYISKEERKACGITGAIKKDARYVLVREVKTRHGVANPNEGRCPMLPKGLPELKQYLLLCAIGFLWKMSMVLLYYST